MHQIYQETQKLLDGNSLAANVTSLGYNVSTFGYATVQCDLTGSPVGVLKLQASVDGTIWSDVFGTATLVVGAMTKLWTEEPTIYNQIRIVYTSVSGSGNITGYACAKVF